MDKKSNFKVSYIFQIVLILVAFLNPSVVCKTLDTLSIPCLAIHKLSKILLYRKCNHTKV